MDSMQVKLMILLSIGFPGLMIIRFIQFVHKLKKPTIENFEREGFFVTEWGVIL
ncbi:MAG: hypothetical protein PF436_04735 [Prolixibacteraceae bacterium]|jgi:hypothetical protein|nr:hypothetical protein [Prolixibacteraceae bacterium]